MQTQKAKAQQAAQQTATQASAYFKHLQQSFSKQSVNTIHTLMQSVYTFNTRIVSKRTAQHLNMHTIVIKTHAKLLQSNKKLANNLLNNYLTYVSK